MKPHSYSFLDTTALVGSWYYRLKQIDLDSIVHFADGLRIEVLPGVDISSLPRDYVLHQNYSNPFNPTTTILYEIAGSRDESIRSPWVTLKVYDLLGREVATLVDESKDAGAYSAQFDASNIATGVYFYRLLVAPTARRDLVTQTRALMVVR